MLGGEYRHTLDPKNRLFIPAKFRDQLGTKFFLVMGSDHCISVYSETAWQERDAQLNELPESKAGRLKRIVYSSLAEVEPDAQGRILIPTTLRNYANLSKNAVIIGVSNHAEIWNEDAWDAYSKGDDAEGFDLAAEMEALGL